jgi:hypothetical protein
MSVLCWVYRIDLEGTNRVHRIDLKQTQIQRIDVKRDV